MSMRKWWIGLLIVALVGVFGCSDDGGSSSNNQPIDVNVGDSGSAGDDTGSPEVGPADSGSADVSTPDVASNNNAPDASGDGGGSSSGRDGLEGFCDHYVDCGGTYYADADACISASIDYWGECRRDELDAFGDCMMELSCDEWGNPDTYNPASTDCSDEWSEVRSASCE
jgi:hypothetical protein